MTRRFKYYTPLFLQKVGYVVFYFLHTFFVHLEVNGKENLEGLKGPLILASNHTSEVDPTVIPLVLPLYSPLYPIYYVANPMEKYNNFGWRSYVYGAAFFNSLGAYSVHSGFHDYSISLEDHVDLLEMGRTVFIFPEGKRTEDGNLSPARGGLGYMIYETQVPIVPIVINTFYGISFLDYLLRRKKVVITVLPVIKSEEIINTDNPTVEDYKKASQFVMDKIGEVL
ncbi:MAG TPA: lysophospholipid acyltransferase family protein [Candidatus Paceibacterota bacterium]